MKNKTKGLMDELAYCKKKVADNHPSPHWTIRIKEINILLKKGKKNVKNKAR